MIIYKCKMCGGNLNVEEGSKVVTCDYCRTQQTVPSTDDERRANLFNRANHFRQNSEFDKAISIYEHIINEDDSDAEAYWSMALCRYGVEYVEDPGTGLRKPTINRTQKQSILNDADYIMALEHADYEQRNLYEEEAFEIDRIQKEILRIANKENPYDVFICYKEKNEVGDRTKSSVMAQNLYDKLSREGFRVFFSRITLEDKIGQKYEPYIYSALLSSKVMLVIATNKDEYNAPWVKNEWNRFLVMKREDSQKVLIPCFADLDIDDMPNEFQVLQSQDMTKIGYEQDLIRGIKKILKDHDMEESVAKATDFTVSLERILKNAETNVSMGNFSGAYEMFETVTKQFPEDYRGWWGLIICKTRNLTEIGDDPKIVQEWFSYTCKCADQDELKALQGRFIDYYGIISPSMAKDEISEVNDAIEKETIPLNKLKDERERILKSIKEVKPQKNQRISELEEKKERYDQKIYEMRNEEDIIPIICVVCAVISFFFGLFFHTTYYQSEPQGAVQGLIAGMAVAVLLIVSAWAIKKFNLTKSDCEPIERKIAETCNEIETTKKELDEFDSLSGKKLEKLNYEISEMEISIGEMKKYIEQGNNRIASLIVDSSKRDYGMAFEDDEGLEKRDRVLKILNDGINIKQ